MIFEDYSKFKAAGLNPTVCIIGSGPAGISLALQLEKQKISSLIVEAGDLTYTADSQDAYKGKVIGDEYPGGLETSRLRYFGGTSGHWAGFCRPLDDVDFEVRKGFENSGWPIKKKDLDPYRKETESILEIESFPEDIPVNDDVKEVFFRFSPPVRFGEKYREHIKQSSLITMLIKSPVKSLVPTNQKITHIEIQSEKNKTEKINAKYFCVCTGGVENSRVLLWSNKVHNGGVVPHAETLGKYWMEHPHYNIGHSLMYRPSKLSDGESWIRFFAPSSKFLRENAIGNFAFRIWPINGLKQTLMKDGACTAVSLFSKLLSKPKELEMCTEDIKVSWGQLPASDNRIELNNEKDALGIPRVNLYWEKQPIDRVTAQVAAKLFGTYIIQKDAGRLKLASWLADGHDYPSDDEKVGFHHMGGTRMASTPEKGVVDANCKVFGMDNLFIGGSSVFATGGHANPTYTIVQLALRLGDHLKALETSKSS